MKAFERIFLYTVLAILVFYVFLVDENVESQSSVYEEIRARSIVVVDDKGNPVILIEDCDGIGGVWTFYKDGSLGAFMGTNNKEGGAVGIYNKNGSNLVSISQTEKGEGAIWISDRYGENTAIYGHEK